MSAKSFIIVLFLVIISGFCGAFITYLFLNLDHFYGIEENKVNVVEYNLPLEDKNTSTQDMLSSPILEQNLTHTSLEQNNTLQNNAKTDSQSKEQQRSQTANAHDESILENPQMPQEYFISDMPPAVVVPKETKEQNQTIKVQQDSVKNIKKDRKDYFIKELSNKNFQIYTKNGEKLSQYRIKLLKDIFKPLYENIRETKIKILITLLDNNNMSLTLQNLDLIDKKNLKNYANLSQQNITLHYNSNKIEEFSNKNSLLDFIENYKNNSLVKLVKIKAYSDGKGSDFANYMLGLKRGAYLAHFFLNFSEEIEIVSFGKENYPKNAGNSEEQRYQYRKVEISF